MECLNRRNKLMDSARKQLVIGPEPQTVSPHSSRLEPAVTSLASASLGDSILEKVRESKPGAEQEPVRNGLPETKKFSEVVRIFCRTPERDCGFGDPLRPQGRSKQLTITPQRRSYASKPGQSVA